MVRLLSCLAASAALAALFLTTSEVEAQVSAAPASINFQGRLATPSGNPVPDGTYSIRFSLWTAVSAGTEKWNQTLSNVTVKNGTFAVPLSGFPANTFDGNLWLEIKLGTDAPLSPRTQIVSVPYAIKSNLALTVPDSSLTASKFAPNTLSNAVGGLAWLLNGNAGTNSATQFLGTTDNQALVLKTNNAERMRIFSNGNTGIGTIEAFHRLTVQSNDNYTLRLIGAGITGEANYGQGGKLNFGDGDLVYLQEDSDDKLTLYAGNRTAIMGGNVGIGTTSPAARLEVNSGGGVRASLKLEHSGSNFIVRPFGAGSARTVIENTAGAIYINSPTSILNASYSNTALTVGTNGLDWAIVTEGDLDVHGDAYSNAGYLVSDARFKQNIETVPNALSQLLALRGVTYEMNRTAFPKRNFAQGKQMGFLAQEVEQVLPQLVKTKDGYKAVNYQGIIPITVEAIKTLNARSVMQQNQINARDAKIAELEAKLAELAEAVAQLKAQRK